MSYSNIKPLAPEPHNFIAEWVKNGGILINSGRDTDPFQSIQEWWNTGDYNYKTPSEHLFEKMKIDPSPKGGEYTYGKGTVYIIRKDPKEFVLEKSNDEELINIYLNKKRMAEL